MHARRNHHLFEFGRLSLQCFVSIETDTSSIHQIIQHEGMSTLNGIPFLYEQEAWDSVDLSDLSEDESCHFQCAVIPDMYLPFSPLSGWLMSCRAVKSKSLITAWYNLCASMPSLNDPRFKTRALKESTLTIWQFYHLLKFHSFEKWGDYLIKVLWRHLLLSTGALGARLMLNFFVKQAFVEPLKSMTKEHFFETNHFSILSTFAPKDFHLRCRWLYSHQLTVDLANCVWNVMDINAKKLPFVSEAIQKIKKKDLKPYSKKSAINAKDAVIIEPVRQLLWEKLLLGRLDFIKEAYTQTQHQGIEALPRSAINELKALKNPPKVVKEAMLQCLVLLGCEVKEWDSKAKKALKHLNQKIQNFKPKKLKKTPNQSIYNRSQSHSKSKQSVRAIGIMAAVSDGRYSSLMDKAWHSSFNCKVRSQLGKNAMSRILRTT